MAYSKELAARVSAQLDELPNLVEKKMFGGVGYLLNGNMACGVLNDDLIVRVGAENYQQALDEPHTKLFDTTGRQMRGWVMVTPDGLADDAELAEWVQKGVDFASTLPPK